MCFDLDVTESEFAMSRALLLSQKIRNGHGIRRLIEVRRYWIAKASCIACNNAIYFASVDNNAIVRCLTEDQETRLEYRKNAYPVVLFLFNESDAQFASTAPKSAGSISLVGGFRVRMEKLYLMAQSFMLRR